MSRLEIYLEDKINVALLEKETLPALIVEGKDDYYIYSHMFKLSGLDWDYVDIVIGKGKQAILDSINNNELSFDYIALLDADFDRFRGCCEESNYIVYTHFYSIENYLLTSEVLGNLIDHLNTIKNKPIQKIEFIDNVVNEIRPLIAAYIAKIENEWPIKLQDCNIQRWWPSNGNKKISSKQLKEYITEELSALGINPLDWNEYYTRAKSFDEIAANQIIPGRQMLDVVFWQLKRHFKSYMKGRNPHILEGDLCREVYRSSFVLELILLIDNKLEELNVPRIVPIT